MAISRREEAGCRGCLFYRSCLSLPCACFTSLDRFITVVLLVLLLHSLYCINLVFSPAFAALRRP